MNWFRQPAEGQTQNDHRVVVKTQGRAKGTTLLIELKDDGWIQHGDGESVLAAEAMQEAADDLQGRQADVFDYIKERWLLGEFPVAATELASHFNLERNKTHRCLRSLERKGLVEQAGRAETEGGRPALLFRPTGVSSLEGGQTSQRGQSTPYTHDTKPLSPLSPLSPIAGGDPPLSPLSVGDAVERFAAGLWSNGWVVQDVSDPLSITIAKLGNPLVQFRNQRPDLDIRPCQSSPFAATTPEPDPFDF
jgi:hypothetical protein